MHLWIHQSKNGHNLTLTENAVSKPHMAMYFIGENDDNPWSIGNSTGIGFTAGKTPHFQVPKWQNPSSLWPWVSGSPPWLVRCSAAKRWPAHILAALNRPHILSHNSWYMLISYILVESNHTSWHQKKLKTVETCGMTYLKISEMYSANPSYRCHRSPCLELTKPGPWDQASTPWDPPRGITPLIGDTLKDWLDPCQPRWSSNTAPIQLVS